MSYQNSNIADVSEKLKLRIPAEGRAVLRAVEIKALFDELRIMPPEQRGTYGKELNQLKKELETLVNELENPEQVLAAIDVTAPMDVNVAENKAPHFLPVTFGSKHPLMTELELINDIAYRMGFEVMESRQLDDDYHMFESLNFPAGHPARDDYDTFMTDEGLVAPAHTSTMQNRALLKYKENLAKDQPIAVVLPGRVFRNEDLDATHEHTFYQFEGVYVGRGVNVGNLIGTLQVFLSDYFGQELKAKIQPFYFPFTEPSFEFAVERPLFLRKDTSHAEQWLELGGCGMIHPNVLKAAGIDSNEFTGFAWGFGIERLVMMKNKIEDVRHFESGKLDFLRQFS